MKWNSENRHKLYLLIKESKPQLRGLGVRRANKAPEALEKDPKYITIPDPNSSRPSDSALALHYILKARDAKKKWTKYGVAKQIMDECGIAVSPGLVKTCGSYPASEQTERAVRQIKICYLKIPKDTALKLLVLGAT